MPLLDAGIVEIMKRAPLSKAEIQGDLQKEHPIIVKVCGSRTYLPASDRRSLARYSGPYALGDRGLGGPFVRFVIGESCELSGSVREPGMR